MVLVGYLVQFIIIFGWYKFILVKKFKCKNIVRRSMRILFTQRKNIIFSFLRWGNISKEQEKAVCSIKKHLSEMFMETYLLMGYFILGPIILKCFINYENRGILGSLFYLVLLCGLIFSRLKEDTQKTIEIINAYTQNVMTPLEKKPELLSFEDVQKPVIEWNVKKILIILMGLLAMITCIVLLEQFKDSKVFQVIAVVVFVFVMIRESSNVSSKNNIDIGEGIYVEGYILDSVKEDIQNMCVQLGIKTIECKIVATERYAESKINEKGIPQIDISNGYISQIYGSTARDILLMTIAHELGHIYYNDFSNISKRVRISNLVCLILMILNMLGLIATMITPIFLVITLLSVGIECVFGKIMCDARYWKQIAELRADRLAINVCKSNKMIFVEFWKGYLKNQRKEETNIIDQFYRRCIKVEGHPSMEYRMELIEKREKWSWWEYFEHALVIMKWCITNRGWNGV